MLGRSSALWQREEDMLKKAACYAVLALIMIAAFAADSHATKLAGEFLQTGLGAKALAMGGAYVSVADDASATYWNPAGLVLQEKRQILLPGKHAVMVTKKGYLTETRAPFLIPGRETVLRLRLLPLASAIKMQRRWKRWWRRAY